MRIALVHNRCQLGGIETVVLQLLRGLRARGDHAEFWVAEGKSYPAEPGLRPMYPRVLSQLDHSRFHPAVARLFPRKRWTDAAFRRLASSDFDIIHVHGFFDGFASAASFAHVARHKPLVLTVHSLWFVTGGCYYPLGCTRYREACGNCPQVGHHPIGQTDRTADELAEKIAHFSNAPAHVISPSAHYIPVLASSAVGRGWRTSWIPNGVAPQRYHGAGKRDAEFRQSLGLDPSLPLVLVSSRDFRDPYKNASAAVTALLAQTRHPLQIALSGHGTAAAARELAARFPVADLGYVADADLMAQWYRAADFFLFPSLDENFPCAVLEAMASECCVIGFPIPALREQLVHGESGILAGDQSPDALARALDTALADPGLAPRIGAAARQRVLANFTEDTMLDAHLALYASLVSTARSQP